MGDSRMNFLNLLLHGLSALSVYGEVIGVRLLVVASILLAVDVGVLTAVFALQYFGGVSPPRRLLFAGGILFFLLFEVIVVSGVLMFSMLSSRANLTFVPLRDYKYFLRDTEEIFRRSTEPGSDAVLPQ